MNFSSQPAKDGESVSSARLVSVLDTASDGIVIIDALGHILMFNPACERLFGQSAPEVLGKNIDMLMTSAHGSVYDSYLRHYNEAGERKITGIGREVVAKHRSGLEFPIEFSLGVAAIAEGHQFIGILRDLRPRKEADERVRELQSDLIHIARVTAIDEMGAALAHELNQPLTAILLYLQTLTRGPRKGDPNGGIAPEIALIIGKAIHEADRAGKIIQRMRSFAEKREPQRKLHDMRALIDDALELTLLGNRVPVRIVRIDEPNLPKIMVDGVQIQQIIVNLVRNALEAVRGREQAEIRISLRLTNDDVQLEINDSGPGIAVDMVNSLFKVFSTSKRTGLGIGLAISRTIAQNHGGELTCEPGGHGRGATFILRLPREGGTLIHRGSKSLSVK